jgi:hypothetical protein
VPALFPGMEIKGGRLDPKRVTPYYSDARSTASLYAIFSVTDPVSEAVFPESTILVDTSASVDLSVKSGVKFIFTSESMVLSMSGMKPRHFSYASFFPGMTSIILDNKNITGLMKSYFSVFYVINLAQHIMSDAVSVAFAVIFLSFAAYIFNNEGRRRKYGDYLKMAFFAASPIPVLTILAAAASVRFEWIWQAGVMVSTIVMFRALRGSIIERQREDKQKSGWPQ